jgi:hypothetical protein
VMKRDGVERCKSSVLKDHFTVYYYEALDVQEHCMGWRFVDLQLPV